MKGYSKIKIISSAKPRSMDLSDPSTFLEPTKANNIETHRLKLKELETNFKNHSLSKNNTKLTITNNKYNIKDQDSPLSWLQEDLESNNNVEIFDSFKIKRNSSVSSASIAIHSTVKKVFSITRSSSVSERYCRIHDQSVALPSPTIDDDDDGSVDTIRSVKRKNSKGKIFRACKKLLGL